MKNKNKLSVYLHIPFCVKKCDYCDFLSAPSDDTTINQYVNVLCKEIATLSHYKESHEIDTLFVGGGTPSILTPTQLDTMFLALHSTGMLTKDIEFTMEANPGTLSCEKLSVMKEAGVNRLSIGLQSTHDDCLQALGRIHTYKQFLNTYETARDRGFDNINIDIMSAIPLLTMEKWKQTLDSIICLNPEHISAYSLIIEEGTPFYEAGETLTKLLPEEDIEREMYYITDEKLSSFGYKRYEISNYSKKSKECKHNIAYWKRKEYIGIGLGAASLMEETRYTKETSLQRYIENGMENHFEKFNKEVLSKQEQMEEFMFLGLRMMEGIHTGEFETIFGCSIWDVYGDAIQSFINQGFLEMEEKRLFLSTSGIDVSNEILCHFIL